MRGALLLVPLLCAVGATPVGEEGGVAPAARVPFEVGEVLTFSVEYGFITAGEVRLSILSVDTVQGRPCYHLRSEARTSETFSAFYRVEDRADSYLDVEELVPRQHRKRLQHGRKRTEEDVIFDQDRGVAYYADGDTVPVLPRTQDVLSAFFAVRSRDLQVGMSFSLPTHDHKKNYPLEVRVLRSERVLVPAGRFDCLVVEPLLRDAGIFRGKGSLTLWLTADERRLPVLMRSRVTFGSVSAVLVRQERAAWRASGGGSP